MASIYDKQILTKSDLERINSLNDAWKAANDKKTKDRLHAQAEAIRNSYGYSGGGDGSEFIIKSADVLNTAAAGKNYTDALQNAHNAQSEGFTAQQDAIERDKDSRLREAYIKNMQDTLGLSQSLKAAGVSGGASESTRAYMTNVYNNNRNDIVNDATDAKLQLAEKKAEADSKLLADIAKAEYDGAKDRADAISNAEKLAYERQLDEYKKQTDLRDFEYKKAKDERDFEYNKAVDERDFEYGKTKDERDFEYNKIKDAASLAASKSSKSDSVKMTPSNVMTLIKSGIYNPDFAEVLGITDDEVREIVDNYKSDASKEIAWRLMSKGIYDDSFPEILGYSPEILKSYVEHIMGGF